VGTGSARFAVGIVLISVQSALGQVAQRTPQEQARRLLEDGQRYRAEQKWKQAVDNFNTIINGFPDTDSVDDALLALGRYQAEVEGDLDKARESFQKVTQQFPQSDQAPGAYYWLGMLTLRQAAGQAELDDAVAQFDRVRRLYPGSSWVPAALYGSGLAMRRSGDVGGAAELQRRVSMEYPTGEVAAQAQYELGHLMALLGEPLQAMEDFQQVRNRFPGSPLAERARERITALYRFRRGAPSFTRDPSFSVSGGDVMRDVRALLLDEQGNLWIASDKTDSAVSFDPEGRMGRSFPGKDLGDLALTPDGAPVVAARTAVRIGERDIRSFSLPGPKPEPLERIRAAAVLPGGDFLVADEKLKAVHRFDASGGHLGPFPDSGERRIIRLGRDAEGGIYMLDERSGVSVFDAKGERIRSLPPRGAGYELREPVDVAFDAALNSYVVDRKSAAVFVFSPAGQLLGTLGRDSLEEPEAIALEPSGSVLVYDNKARQVLRFH